VQHYESQYPALDEYGDTVLSAAIRQFCSDEASHRDEAGSEASQRSALLTAWCSLVSFGSEQAVKVARKL
jgi:ubiquinone biosynthesis monooxygenase Coq7